MLLKATLFIGIILLLRLGVCLWKCLIVPLSPVFLPIVDYVCTDFLTLAFVMITETWWHHCSPGRSMVGDLSYLALNEIIRPHI